jgi:hypothetical protein
VVNAASGKVIFDPQDSSGALGGTASGSTVTLAYDTTPMSAADRLVVIYNSLERDDQLFTFSPTTTGPLAAMAVKGFMSAMVDIRSSTGCSSNLEGTVDNTQWKAIKGQLPNLDSNTGDTNFNEGKPFNMRQCDVTPYRLIRFNVTSIAAGSPAINILLKTVPAPPRLFIANGGSLVANFDSGGSVGYVRQTSLYTETFRGALTADQVVTGAARQANGQPNPYYSRFGATVVSDQSGSLQIQASTDGTNWITVATQAVVGGTPFDLEVKVRAALYRAVFTNGGTATGANAFSLLSAFCGA